MCDDGAPYEREVSFFFGLGKSCSIVWKGLDLRIVGHSFVTYNLLFVINLS